MIWTLLLVALTVGVTIQNTPDFDLNTFKDKLSWDGVDMGGETDLSNALESVINGLGDAFFHLAKWIAQVASENPQIPFKLIIVLVILAIIAPILIFLIKAIVIIFLLIREWRFNRRERKEKKLLKEMRQNELVYQNEPNGERDTGIEENI